MRGVNLLVVSIETGPKKEMEERLQKARTSKASVCYIKYLTLSFRPEKHSRGVSMTLKHRVYCKDLG